jgi:hypothetical protein
VTVTYILIFLSFAFKMAGGGLSGEERQKYTWPRCIAGICFDDFHRISKRNFENRYGKPTTEDEVYCYEVPEQKLFVRFAAFHVEPKEIAEVFVSKAQNCLKTFSPTVSAKSRFKEFVTPEHIRLGDPYSKVLATYGPPTSVDRADGLDLRGLEYSKALDSTPFGDKVLMYSTWNGTTVSDDQLPTAFFYFDKGRVSAICISANE